MKTSTTWFALLFGLLIFLGTLYFAKAEYDSGNANVAVAIVAAGIALIGVVANWALFNSLNSQLVDERKRHTTNLINDWLKPDAIELSSYFHRYILKLCNNPKPPMEIMKDLKEDEKLNRSMLFSMGFLENIAISVKYNITDEETIKNFFSISVEFGYENLRIYIDELRRDSGNDDVWEQLEWLYNRWNEA